MTDERSIHELITEPKPSKEAIEAALRVPSYRLRAALEAAYAIDVAPLLARIDAPREPMTDAKEIANARREATESAASILDDYATDSELDNDPMSAKGYRAAAADIRALNDAPQPDARDAVIGEAVNVLRPFYQAAAVIDALPPQMRPENDAGARAYIAGLWPTVGELRAARAFVEMHGKAVDDAPRDDKESGK